MRVLRAMLVANQTALLRLHRNGGTERQKQARPEQMPMHRRSLLLMRSAQY